MFGLRQKLLVGLGGLVAILLLVSGLGVAVLRQHQADLNRFLYENWRSVQYGLAMIDDVEKLDALAASATPPPAAQAYLKNFDQQLNDENKNITLTGEAELAQTLNKSWRGIELKSGRKLTTDCYRDAYAALMTPDATNHDATDHAADLQTLRRLSPALKLAAHGVVKLNLDPMAPMQGRIAQISQEATRLMILLAAAGTALGAGFAVILGRSILQPLGTLTRSFREIEQGNLDLVVQVKTRDELHQLAEAFNSMAAKLRELRRTDRAKLIRTQRTTQLAVNSLPDAIAIINPDGVVELANDAATRLFGLKPGESVSTVSDQRLSALYKQASRELRAVTPKGYESAIEVSQAAGQNKYFLPHAVPIHDGEQRLLGVTLVLGDVTNLRKLDEMKSGLLSVVSHELKTPLTSIRMAVHLLLEERIGALNSKQAELLSAARDDSDRLHKIIENLLDMGRLESGRVELDLQPQEARKLIADALAPLEAAFHDRGIKLEVDVPQDCPRVLADPARIDHVFTNLLTNAMKFTQPGGSVRITAAPEGPAVRFVVQDTGIGIPREHLSRVFDRFYRVLREGQPGGAGLGLAIAREIVQAHGGQIDAQSRENQGSRLSFTLRGADPVAASTEVST